MLRRRMIDPTIWADEHFGKLSDKAKILFVACISNADDDGRLSGHTSNLRALCFRFTDISLGKIQELRDELQENLKNFNVYSVNSCEYIQLDRWVEYQSIRSDRYKPSRFPPTTKCQPSDNQMTHKVKESKVKESKGDILSCKQDPKEPIEYLNQKAKKSFSPTNKASLSLVRARFAEGRTIADFKRVIDLKCSKWLRDDKMMDYLRPKTLFSATNFENYLNEKESNYGLPDSLKHLKPL